MKVLKNVISYTLLVSIIVASNTLFSSCQIFCEHDYSIFISDTATCEKNGIKTYECSKCKKQKTEPSEALGHHFVFFDDTTTCEEAGVITYKCDRCRKVYTENHAAYGHNFEVGNFYCSGNNFKCKATRYKIEVQSKQVKKYDKSIASDWFEKSVETRFSIDNYLHVDFRSKGYGLIIHSISYVLKEKDGKIIKKGSRNFYDNYLSHSASYEDVTYWIVNIVYKGDLDTNKDYVFALTVYV